MAVREPHRVAELRCLIDRPPAARDLAEVLSLAGHFEEARAALEEALLRYERKENLVMAKRIRERLAALDSRHAVQRPATAGR